ncbi:MAG TPA: scramblase [bacterium]|nr:scramblase [bacterium]
MTIPPLFRIDEFFINEKVNFLKFVNEYKIFEKNGEEIGAVRQKLTTGDKVLRMLLSKKMLPFDMSIVDKSEKVLTRLKRGWTFWLSQIEILDEHDRKIGHIKQKFTLLKPKLEIYDEQDLLLAVIQGNWIAWNFEITSPEENSIGVINKKWSGIGKELFTTADNYHVVINREYAENTNKMIILSAAIAIDMIYKENK